MEDIPRNPAFHSPPALVEHGPIPASTCSEPRTRRSVPPEILAMVSEIGLRYQPSAQADLQAHGAKVALLASDIADLNPLKLRLAIARWVSFKPYLPKASDLRAITEAIIDSERDPANLQHWCDDRNVWAARMGMDWWYRITHRALEDGSKRAEVEKLEGTRAIEARAWAEGRPHQQWRPEPGEIEAINAKVSECVQRGMTQAEFSRLVDQGRMG